MPFDRPHTVSPSLWALAWKRLRADRVAMVSLTIVALFLLQMILSGVGLIAKDWAKEVGVNYAPPTLQGPDAEGSAPAATAGGASAGQAASDDEPTELPVQDPLADALAAIRGEPKKPAAAEAAGAESQSVDPLADVMADIRAKGTKAEAAEARALTLPLGGDKWGRDVLKKT